MVTLNSTTCSSEQIFENLSEFAASEAAQHTGHTSKKSAHTCTYTQRDTLKTHTHKGTHTHTHTNTHTYAHAYAHVQTHSHTYLHAHITHITTASSRETRPHWWCFSKSAAIFNFHCTLSSEETFEKSTSTQAFLTSHSRRRDAFLQLSQNSQKSELHAVNIVC